MLRMVPLPVPGRIGNGRSPPQSRRSNYLAHHILRTAQPDAFARFDDRALDIGGIGGHRGDDIVLPGILQPPLFGVGSAPPQRVARTDTRTPTPPAKLVRAIGTF